MTRFLMGQLSGCLVALVLLLVILPTPFGWSPSGTVQPMGPMLHSDSASGTDFRDGAAPSRPATAPGLPLPQSAIGMRPAPTEEPRTASTLRGTVSGLATWFRSPAGVSAAGPRLRAAIGAGWRGSVVRVTANGRSIVTVLGDWMAADRLIDLDDDAFRALAPLSTGVIRVTITWPAHEAPPDTSTEDTP